MKKMMLKSIAIFLTTSTLLLQAAGSAKSSLTAKPTVHVNMSIVFSKKGSQEFVDKIASLEKENEGRIKELQETSKKLEAIFNELNDPNKGKWMSAEAKEAKNEEARRLASVMQNGERYLQELQVTLQKEIHQKMADICKAIAQEKGYAAIGYAEPMMWLYIDPAYDITNEVIERMNSAYKKGKK